MKINTSTQKGFTLVELLVVISIIAVLVSMATPALMSQLRKAKIVKSTGICKAIELAVDNFESEYNFLPYGGSEYPAADEDLRSDANVVSVLAGVEDEINFKQIRFFELDEPKGTSAASYKDGMNITGTSPNATAQLYDPWGETYYLTFDYDLDGEVDHPFDAGEAIRRKVICWSAGPDKEFDTSNPKGKINLDNPSNFD